MIQVIPATSLTEHFRHICSICGHEKDNNEEDFIFQTNGEFVWCICNKCSGNAPVHEDTLSIDIPYKSILD